MNLSKASGQESWFTDEDIPDDPNPPIVQGWRLLVRPVPNKRKTKGGILLPDQVLEVKDLLGTLARVIAVGPLAYSRADMLVNGNVKPWCKVGDYVTYGRYAGARVLYGGIKYLTLNDDEITNVIPDPTKFLE